MGCCWSLYVSIVYLLLHDACLYFLLYDVDTLLVYTERRVIRGPLAI